MCRPFKPTLHCINDNLRLPGVSSKKYNIEYIEQLSNDAVPARKSRILH